MVLEMCLKPTKPIRTLTELGSSVPEIYQGPNNTAEAEEYRKSNLAAVHAESQFSSQILRCCQALLREGRPVLYDNAELIIHCGY